MKKNSKALEDRQLLKNDKLPAELKNQAENGAECELSDADLGAVNGAGDAMEWAKMNRNQMEKQ